MAALALCATPTHASLMASSTMDDHLAVHNDANSLRSGKQKIPAMALQATGQEQTGVGRTQSIPTKSLMYAVARIGVFKNTLNTHLGRSPRNGRFICINTLEWVHRACGPPHSAVQSTAPISSVSLNVPYTHATSL